MIEFFSFPPDLLKRFVHAKRPQGSRFSSSKLPFNFVSQETIEKCGYKNVRSFVLVIAPISIDIVAVEEVKIL